MRLITILASAALIAGAGPVAAAVHILNLTGGLAGASTFAFTIGKTHYDQFYLNLAGLDPSNAFTAALGDSFNATVTLDGLLTVPASKTFTAFGLFLTGSSFPPINTSVTGTTAFFAGLAPVRSGEATTTTSGQLVNSVVYGSPFNTAFTFDSLTSTFAVDGLASPVTLDRSFISYTLASTAVPEPAGWALLVAGFAVVGIASRRQRRAAAIA